MLRHAFQTALLHLKPPPKPSCQMRSPLLMLPVCSRLANMYLESMNACEVCTPQLGLLHPPQSWRLESVSHEATVCQMQASFRHAGLLSDSPVRYGMSSSEC